MREEAVRFPILHQRRVNLFDPKDDVALAEIGHQDSTCILVFSIAEHSLGPGFDEDPDSISADEFTNVVMG